MSRNRIRIARDVPYAITSDMAGATGSKDTRQGNELHTKPLKKRSGPNFRESDVTYTRPLNVEHPLYLRDVEQQD
jgi:hypothetical protein